MNHSRPLQRLPDFDAVSNSFARLKGGPSVGAGDQAQLVRSYPLQLHLRLGGLPGEVETRRVDAPAGGTSRQGLDAGRKGRIVENRNVQSVTKRVLRRLRLTDRLPWAGNGAFRTWGDSQPESCKADMEQASAHPG